MPESDLRALERIFQGQAERQAALEAKWAGTDHLVADWDQLTVAVYASGDEVDAAARSGGVQLMKVEGLEVGFVFDKDGNLLGAYNWKE